MLFYVNKSMRIFNIINLHNLKKSSHKSYLSQTHLSSLQELQTHTSMSWILISYKHNHTLSLNLINKKIKSQEKNVLTAIKKSIHRKTAQHIYLIKYIHFWNLKLYNSLNLFLKSHVNQNSCFQNLTWNLSWKLLQNLLQTWTCIST